MGRPRKIAARKGGKTKRVEVLEAEIVAEQEQLTSIESAGEVAQEPGPIVEAAEPVIESTEPEISAEDAQKYEAEAVALLEKAGWILLSDAKIEDARDGPDGRWTFRFEGRYSRVLVKK